jgi:hypothetical protein
MGELMSMDLIAGAGERRLRARAFLTAFGGQSPTAVPLLDLPNAETGPTLDGSALSNSVVRPDRRVAAIGGRVRCD